MGVGCVFGVRLSTTLQNKQWESSSGTALFCYISNLLLHIDTEVY